MSHSEPQSYPVVELGAGIRVCLNQLFLENRVLLRYDPSNVLDNPARLTLRCSAT